MCGNTAAMLAEIRYAPFFDITGDGSVPYGLFDCVPQGDVVDGSAPCC